MPKLFTQMSLSLDGFVAGPGDGPDNGLGDGGDLVHEWIVATASWRGLHGMEGGGAGPDDAVVSESVGRSGATILGRRMFDNGEEPWGEDPPFHHPVFVVTHRDRPPLERRGGTTYHFVTDGIESALAQARDAAGDADVEIGGGANLIQQYLIAGLLDEIELHTAPVFLGGGVRMFDRPELTGMRLVPGRVLGSPAATHVRYDVVR